MNLLFIFTDQQNRYALGCMDNPNVDTPHLDQLSERGVLFRRCYSNDPVCGPFRGSLLTGQYTSRCGVTDNGVPLPTGVPTFADAFNEAGYSTSWVGKWHLGGKGNEPITEEKRGGFKNFIGYQCYNGFNDQVCFYDEEDQEHLFHQHRTEVTTNLAIDRLEGLAILRDDTISRERRTLRARYQLTDLSTGEIVLDATDGSDAGIDVVSSEYAVIAAEQTALENLSQDLAQRIVTRVALALRDQR